MQFFTYSNSTPRQRDWVRTFNKLPYGPIKRLERMVLKAGKCLTVAKVFFNRYVRKFGETDNPNDEEGGAGLERTMISIRKNRSLISGQLFTPVLANKDSPSPPCMLSNRENLVRRYSSGIKYSYRNKQQKQLLQSRWIQQTPPIIQSPDLWCQPQGSTENKARYVDLYNPCLKADWLNLIYVMRLHARDTHRGSPIISAVGRHSERVAVFLLTEQGIMPKYMRMVLAYLYRENSIYSDQ